MRRLIGTFLLALAWLAVPGDVASPQSCPVGYTPMGRGPGTGFDCVLGRSRLTTNLNTYVNPSTGVDPSITSNVIACTQAAPCLTIERAFYEIAKYDLGSNAAFINLANGTYAYTTRITQGPTGTGSIIVKGPVDGSDNCVNRDLVLIRPPAGTGHGFGIAIPGREVTLRCMNIETAIGSIASFAITFHGGTIGFWGDITFGPAESGHVYCNEGARCTSNGNYSVTGGTTYHMGIGNQAQMFNIGRTVTFANSTINFSVGFAFVERGGGLSLTANEFQVKEATVTISNASPGVVTWTGHALLANTPVKFTTTGSLPTGLSPGVVYYVRNVLGVDTFTVSATVGGTEINTSSAGSGTHTGHQFPAVTGRQCFIESGGWLTPGYEPDVTPSLATTLPGSTACQVNNGGVYFISGGPNIVPFSTMSGSGTLNIGFEQNIEIRVTGTGSISSFGPQPDTAIGMYRYVTFDGNYTILNNTPVAGAYILTPDGLPMYVQAGTRIFALFVGGNVWRAYWDIPRTGGLYPSQNYVVNPSFDVWQAGTSFTVTAATRTFVADRWKVYRGVAGLTVTRSAGPTGSNAEYGLQFQRTAGDTSEVGMYMSHQLENRMAYQLRGQYVVLSCAYQTGANYSPVAALNMIFYTGTGTSEEFNIATLAFTTGSVSSGNLQVPGPLAVSSSGTIYTSPYLVPSDVTQMAFIINTAPKSPGGAPAGADDWLRISNCNLNIGRAITPFAPVPKAQVLSEVMRRYQKSFLEATAPAQNVGAATGEFRVGATMTGAAAGTMGTVNFAQQMALTMAGAVPTCTLYNPAGTNAQVRNITDGADLSASAAANIGQMGFEIQTTGSAGTAVGETLGVHWTCDSRM